MVDYRTGMRMEEDVVRQIVEHWISGDHRTYGLVTEEDGETTRRENMIEEVPENELFMTAPSVIAFSFAAKRWGEVYVEHITPIEWADNSYDLLVLDDDLKRMVRSLVTHHRGSFSDIINGKGGGIIFLLHGEPGQGKTLTAETVAEMLHRPLYSVTVGELGIEPSELEESLRRILDVATAWDAVLLIDEADIFLEARDENDVLRNAMVGVFLRLLEYHQGVLFLTTNRVKNIDRAFYSRISFGIQYRGSDETKREKIWHNLLNAAGIEMPDEDIHTLAKHDLNGRQIKNVIRISQTLVKAEPEGAKLLPVFEDVIRSIEEFQSSIGNKEM